jgi:hypothetical protein
MTTLSQVKVPELFLNPQKSKMLDNIESVSLVL